MKLLYVCSDSGIRPTAFKGAAVHVRAITKALAARGHDVRMLSPYDWQDVGGPPSVLHDRHGRSAVKRMTGDVRDWLEGHGYEAGVARDFRGLAFGAWVAKQLPEILEDWRPDAVIERTALFGHLGLDIASQSKIPLILEVNAVMSEEAAAYRGLALADLAGAMEQRVYEAADAIVTVSATLAERLRDRITEPGRVHVVPNGVDPTLFDVAVPAADCRAARGWSDACVVGFCGSLKPWHGVDILIEAFRMLLSDQPAARLLVVGSGPSEAVLRDTVQRCELGDVVHFTGAVPHEQVPGLLRAMDVAVAPFRAMQDFYFSPIKLFEYMAAGSCVVASDLGQITELIEHERTGLLCKPDDPVALASALRTACGDPQKRHAMATAGRDLVHEGYTWDHAAQRVEQITHQACRSVTPVGNSSRPIASDVEVLS